MLLTICRYTADVSTFPGCVWLLDSISSDCMDDENILASTGEQKCSPRSGSEILLSCPLKAAREVLSQIILNAVKRSSFFN